MENIIKKPTVADRIKDGGEFARKEKVDVPSPIASEMAVQIPPVYYWEDIYNEKSVMMTMAFKIHGSVFGLSYPIEDQNLVRISMMRKKLFGVVKESLDVLVHHGRKVLDNHGNIDPRLVNEQEAIRYKYDPHWSKKVAAFNQLVRAVPITKAKAVELGLLQKPRG